MTRTRLISLILIASAGLTGCETFPAGFGPETPLAVISEGDQDMIAKDLTRELRKHIPATEKLVLATDGSQEGSAIENALRLYGYAVEIGAVGEDQSNASQVKYRVGQLDEATGYAIMTVVDRIETTRLYDIDLEGRFRPSSPLTVRHMGEENG